MISIEEANVLLPKSIRQVDLVLHFLRREMQTFGGASELERRD